MPDAGTIQLRYATVADTPAVAALFRAVVAPLAIYSESARAKNIAAFSAERLAGRIADWERAVLIAETGGRMVGFCIVDEQNGPVWIEWYGVDPALRGRGIGERLIARLIDDATAAGATRIWCDTRVNNDASMALFRKLGFRTLCRLDNHWHGQDFFLWERPLRRPA